jgi:hypothetical protein
MSRNFPAKTLESGEAAESDDKAQTSVFIMAADTLNGYSIALVKGKWL